jgi:thioesterase domain-containing protein/acyl carrier protein
MLPGIQPYPPENSPDAAERVEVYYPASFAQRRLWFLDRLQGPNSAYNVHVGLWLYGPLDLAALHSSLQEIVNRHESFRTSFRLTNDDLLQVVAKNQVVPLPVTDFANVPEPYPRVYEHAQRIVATPFDLSQAPLLRSEILRIAPEEHVLLCTMHHTVTDAWSLQVFVNELTRLYERFSTGRPADLAPLPIQYGDYSEWQYRSLETESARKQLAYWKDLLEGAPALLELPQDAPRPAEQTFRGATHVFPIPSDLIAALASLAPGYQATLFMLLLAAFKVLLYRYGDETDILVGVPVAGRSQVETEGLIGFFVDTLVFRDDLSGNPRFVDLLAQVRETTLGALANADVPFEKVVEALQPERSLSYNPIFQVMFSVIKSAIRVHAFGNISSYPYVVNTSTSIFDLSVTFIEDSDEKWWLALEYNTDLYTFERISRMFDDYTALLRAIPQAAETRIDDLPLATAASTVTMARRKSSRRDGPGKVKRDDLHRIPANQEGRRVLDPNNEEQVLLAEIWKDVLGVSTIGIQDNFFDVGGHSILAVRLVAQIEEATGRKIPVSAVLRAPTIESLARLLKDSPDARPDPLLMQLHRGNAGVPFFAIAAPSVDSMGFSLLARSMGKEQPVYKLQGSGPLVWDRPFEKEELRGLAREYVAAMRTVQPHGPFCLGGMCNGVLIAQQMILELEAQGEDVALFAIFDTWVLENSMIRPLWAVDYYFQRLRAFAKLPWKEQAASAKRVLRGVMGLEKRSAGNDWGKAYWPGETFQPPQFQALVMLFKRPRQPFFYVGDPLMGWGARSTGGVDICEIDCGHFAMLRPPHVQVIGQRLAQRLQALGPTQTKVAPAGVRGQLGAPEVVA